MSLSCESRSTGRKRGFSDALTEVQDDKRLRTHPPLASSCSVEARLFGSNDNDQKAALVAAARLSSKRATEALRDFPLSRLPPQLTGTRRPRSAVCGEDEDDISGSTFRSRDAERALALQKIVERMRSDPTTVTELDYNGDDDDDIGKGAECDDERSERKRQCSRSLTAIDRRELRFYSFASEQSLFSESAARKSSPFRLGLLDDGYKRTFDSLEAALPIRVRRKFAQASSAPKDSRLTFEDATALLRTAMQLFGTFVRDKYDATLIAELQDQFSTFQAFNQSHISRFMVRRDEEDVDAFSYIG